MANEAQFNTTAPSGSDTHWIVPIATGHPVLILSASQEQRVYASIYNDATGDLFITFGNDNVGASGSQQYDRRIASGTQLDLPKPTWQGEIWGIWNGGTGQARVLQLGPPKY